MSPFLPFKHPQPAGGHPVASIHQYEFAQLTVHARDCNRKSLEFTVGRGQ